MANGLGKCREAGKARQTTDSGLRAQKSECASFFSIAVRRLTSGDWWCIWGIMTKRLGVKPEFGVP